MRGRPNRSMIYRGAPIYRAFPVPWSDADCRDRLVAEIENTERMLQRAKENLELFDKGEFFSDDRVAKGLPNR